MITFIIVFTSQFSESTLLFYLLEKCITKPWILLENCHAFFFFIVMLLFCLNHCIFQPVLVGSCGVPLKSILKSDDLNLARELEIRETVRGGRNTSFGSARSVGGTLGTLKVS